MKKSDLIKIIREELKAITEITQEEKKAEEAAAAATLKAKTLAVTLAQKKLNAIKATQVDK